MDGREGVASGCKRGDLLRCPFRKLKASKEAEPSINKPVSGPQAVWERGRGLQETVASLPSGPRAPMRANFIFSFFSYSGIWNLTVVFQGHPGGAACLHGSGSGCAHSHSALTLCAHGGGKTSPDIAATAWGTHPASGLTQADAQPVPRCWPLGEEPTHLVAGARVWWPREGREDAQAEAESFQNICLPSTTKQPYS